MISTGAKPSSSGDRLLDLDNDELIVLTEKENRGYGVSFEDQKSWFLARLITIMDLRLQYTDCGEL